MTDGVESRLPERPVTTPVICGNETKCWLARISEDTTKIGACLKLCKSFVADKETGSEVRCLTDVHLHVLLQ